MVVRAWLVSGCKSRYVLIDVATEPMVLASSLAAQGSVAAVAEGTASAATVAPPTADAANIAHSQRRSGLLVVLMDLTPYGLRTDWALSQTHCDRTIWVPRPGVLAHTAIYADAPANPANECAGEQQELRSFT